MNKGLLATVLLLSVLVIVPFNSLVFAQEEKVTEKVTEKITEKTVQTSPTGEKVTEKVTEQIKEPITPPTSEPIKEFTDVVQEYELKKLYEPTIGTLNSLATNLAESAVVIAGFIIVIFIGWLAGRLAQKILKGIITKWFENEKVLRALGMKKDDFKQSGWAQVHNLIPFTVKWFIWLAFFIVAIDLLDVPQATNALAQLWIWLPRIITFIILISVGFIATRIALRWMNETKPDLFGTKGSMQIVRGIVQGIIYALVFSIGLTTLGVGESIVPIIIWVVLAGVMGCAIAISTGFRHFASAWAISESLKRQGLEKGATIKVGNHEGKIVDVGITHTKIVEGETTKFIPHVLYDANIVELTKGNKTQQNESNKSEEKK